MSSLPWTLRTTTTTAKTQQITGAWDDTEQVLDLYVPDGDPDLTGAVALLKLRVTLGQNSEGKTICTVAAYEYNGTAPWVSSTNPTLASGSSLGSHTFATGTPTATFYDNGGGS